MTFSRESSFIENAFANRTKVEAYTNFIIAVQLNKIITPSILSNSLRQLILNNPTLALTLNFKDDSRQSGIIKPVDLILFDDVVEFSTINNPINEHELKRFNQVICQVGINKPLWRVKVYQYKDIQYITVICEHTLFDGNSGVYFHKDLIEILDKNLNHDNCINVLFDVNNDSHIFDENPPLSALQLIDLYNVPFLTLLKIIWIQKLCPKWLLTYWRTYFNKDLPNLIENPVFKYKPTKKIIDCNHKLINLSSAEVTTLFTNLKRNNFTFTPVISALSCQTFTDIIAPIATPGVKWSTSVQVLVNGRRFYPGLQKQLKYTICVSAVEVILGPITRSNLTKSIDYVKQQVQQDIETKFSFKLMGALKYANPATLLDSLVGTYSRPTIELSNLGNQIIKTENLEVENIWFSQDLGASAQIGYSIISTKGGMNIVLGVVPEIYHLKNEKDQKVIDLYAEELKNRLLTYGN